MRLFSLLLGALLVTAPTLTPPSLAASQPAEVPTISIEDLRAKYETDASRYMEIEGIEIHYMDQGEGPPLVLAHASFMSLRAFDPMVEELKKSYRVIRFDFPGLGLTGPNPAMNNSIELNIAVLDRLTAALGVERFSLLGTSSGGPVAFRFAAQHPERVERLILINSAGMPRTAQSNPNRDRAGNVASGTLPPLNTRAFWQERIDNNFIEPHEPPDWFVDMAYDSARREGAAEEGFAFLQNFETGDPKAVLAQVKAPTMVAWGLQNPTVMHLEADVQLSWLTGAPSILKKYDGVGHYPYIEEPALFARDIDAFLSGDWDDDLRQTQRVKVSLD